MKKRKGQVRQIRCSLLKPYIASKYLSLSLLLLKIVGKQTQAPANPIAMEAQQQQQQQQQPQPQPQPQQYYYQYQTPNDANSAAVSLPYDPSLSQAQSYDQSTQSYYPYQYQHYNEPQPQPQQQDYSSYYYPDYSTSYQTHLPQTDPNSIHPPGVPISSETHQNLYYSHGVVATQPPPAQGYMLLDHSSYAGGGSQLGQSLRGGGGRGTFGRHGKGRGGGRGKHATHGSFASSAAAPSKPPPQKAWCELCKADCNTLEILEQHKNGKKHKKNLKVHEELQNLSRQQQTMHNSQMPVSEPNSDYIPLKPNTKSELSSGAPPPEKSVRKDRFAGRGGLKRSMKGGRGGKWMKANDGSKRPVEPPSKLGFPLICELCNVKCESQVVYESHIAGKKHIANANRIQGDNKETLREGLQAIYPTLPIPASTSTLPPQTHQQDAQALASMILSQQNLPDPQAAQEALTQLLSQHGIHDAQTLLVQLIPYMLTQFQVPGLGMENPQNDQSQEPGFPIEVGSMNGVITESKSEQQNAETKVGEVRNGELDGGECLEKTVEETPENHNNVGTVRVPSAPAKEESSVSEQEKQSS